MEVIKQFALFGGILLVVKIAQIFLTRLFKSINKIQ